MKKVITFSLWGNDPFYNVGAIENAKLAKVFYPDFECWYYIHEETVPLETIEELSKIENTKIIMKRDNIQTCNPDVWRYEAIDEPDVEVMITRDTDSRIFLREKVAVDEWLNSDKLFHIMRDHPYHGTAILGGMFGTKKIDSIPSWKNRMNSYINYTNKRKGYDQDFLANVIYPIVKNISLIHASFCKFENNCKDFPIPYCNEFKFVGERIRVDGSRVKDDVTPLLTKLGHYNLTYGN